MCNRIFQVFVNGKNYVLPFVGVRDEKDLKKEKGNFLFLGKDFVFNGKEDFYNLKAFINQKVLSHFLSLKDTTDNVSYTYLAPPYISYNCLWGNPIDMIRDNFPVIYDENLDAQKVFSQTECAKYDLPEYKNKGKGIVFYDLIERKFKLMGENEFRENYVVKNVFSATKGVYLCIKNNPRDYFLVKFEDSNVAYVKDEELVLTRQNPYLVLEESGKVSVLDHSDRFACFNPKTMDLPEFFSNLNFDNICICDLMKYNQVANINATEEFRLIDSISYLNADKHEEVIKSIP
ncbi:MAG: hypothetical protein IKW39_00335, partial [Alphaproteobacteria bacterium]|nr:hypothetical protein [Alphaproteobacteria bacterium]